MSLYKYPGSKVWTMDFVFQGQRVRESTGTRSKTLAKKVEDNRRRELEEGTSGIRKRRRPRLLSVAADERLVTKKSTLAPSSARIEQTNLDHLIPELGRKVISDVNPSDVGQYQQKRLAAGASAKTVNLEIGTLRAILRRHGLWAALQPDVRMLPVSDDVGRSITAEVERALLEACSKSRSRSLLPFVTLAIETGARYDVIRTLQWGNVDLSNRCLRFGKDKTPSGTGRIVPLNSRAMAILRFWASQFPNRQPEHFVFPAEKYGAAGGKFEPTAYATDPMQPIRRIKEAWEAAKLRAAKILKGISDNADGKGEAEQKVEPLRCRCHDLRHTAVSRMLDASVPIAKVAKIVGWSPATMVRMAARYGHFASEELRGAVETISRAETHEGSPVFPPVSENAGVSERAN